MKTSVTISHYELVIAVKQYLKERGARKVNNVRFSQTGFPDSPDPREQSSAIEATADIEWK